MRGVRLTAVLLTWLAFLLVVDNPVSFGVENGTQTTGSFELGYPTTGNSSCRTISDEYVGVSFCVPDWISVFSRENPGPYSSVVTDRTPYALYNLNNPDGPFNDNLNIQVLPGVSYGEEQLRAMKLGFEQNPNTLRPPDASAYRLLKVEMVQVGKNRSITALEIEFLSEHAGLAIRGRSVLFGVNDQSIFVNCGASLATWERANRLFFEPVLNSIECLPGFTPAGSQSAAVNRPGFDQGYPTTASSTYRTIAHQRVGVSFQVPDWIKDFSLDNPGPFTSMLSENTPVILINPYIADDKFKDNVAIHATPNRGPDEAQLLKTKQMYDQNPSLVVPGGPGQGSGFRLLETRIIHIGKKRSFAALDIQFEIIYSGQATHVRYIIFGLSNRSLAFECSAGVETFEKANVLFFEPLLNSLECLPGFTPAGSQNSAGDPPAFEHGYPTAATTAWTTVTDPQLGISFRVPNWISVFSIESPGPYKQLIKEETPYLLINLNLAPDFRDNITIGVNADGGTSPQRMSEIKQWLDAHPNALDPDTDCTLPGFKRLKVRLFQIGRNQSIWALERVFEVDAAGTRIRSRSIMFSVGNKTLVITCCASVDTFDRANELFFESFLNSIWLLPSSGAMPI